MGKGCTGGNAATVAGAGAAGHPEHGRAGDAVAGGVSKGGGRQVKLLEQRQHSEEGRL